MCTVTFVATPNNVIITSNRDEKILRQNAIAPKNYLLNGKKITFPKDPKAGGTWFAVSEEGTVLVLLNGADEKHTVKEQYSKSRGLVVLDIISAEDPLQEWNKIDLATIEPFTMVLYYQNSLYQLQWDDTHKTKMEMNANEHHIWSSSTLYPEEIRKQRAAWFYEFMENCYPLNQEALLHFHRYTNEDNAEFGLVINRNNILKTLSITQAVLEKNRVSLSHLDLQKEEAFSNCYTTL